MSLEHSHSHTAIHDRIHSKNKNSYVSDWILASLFSGSPICWRMAFLWRPAITAR